MTKKRFLLLLVLFLAVSSVLAVYVFAGCCFNPDSELFCQSEVLEDDCCIEGTCPPGQFGTDIECTLCTGLTGCCKTTCTQSTLQECRYESDLEVQQSCADVDGCNPICCEYFKKTTDTIPARCEFKYSSDCIIDSTYLKVDMLPITQIQCEISSDRPCEGGELEAAITGHVYTQMPGEAQVPAANADITIAGKSATTSADGSYTLSNVQIGQQKVEVFARGWMPKEEIKSVTAPSSVIDMILTEPMTNGILQGHVWNGSKENNLPLKGAYVFWVGREVGAYTDKEGFYRIVGIDPGNNDITAKKGGFTSDTKTVYIIDIPEDIYEMDFELEPTGELPPVEEERCGDDINGDGTPDSSCCEFSYLCPVQAGTNTLKGCSGACCNSPCYTLPKCIDGAIENKKIKDTERPTDYSVQHCTCGGTSYNMDTGEDAEKFCCNDQILQTESCLETGSIKGYIKDKDTGIGINEVEITALSDITSKVSFSSPVGEDEGNFSIGLWPGTYEITFKHYLYKTIKLEDIVVPAGQRIDLGEILLEKESFECAGNIPEPRLSIKNVKGTTNINITWIQPCEDYITDELYPVFTVYRKEQGKSPVSIGTLNKFSRQDDLSYFMIDYGKDLKDGLLWNTEYTYIINTTTGIKKEFGIETGTAPYGDNKTQESKLTGNIICKDKFGDEEFCLNEWMLPDVSDLYPLNTIARCNDGNQPYPYESCPSLCWGPFLVDDGSGNTIQKAFCTEKVECEKLGNELDIKENVFGLFYSKYYPLGGTTPSSCERKNFYEGNDVENLRFCYYDFFHFYQRTNPSPPYILEPRPSLGVTTIDQCLSCRQNGECYDYVSEDSCVNDNCHYGDMNLVDCEWKDMSYEEMGKGICFPKNTDTGSFEYEGERCGLCNSQNNIFENAGCTTNICSYLGNCYSTGSSCESCSDGTPTCEKYGDEEACTGKYEVEFSIPDESPQNPNSCNSAYEFIDSEDSCSLGKCIWQNSKCVKDANGDKIIDCSGAAGYTAETIEFCREDTEAPFTRVIKSPTIITKERNEVQFEVSDNGEFTDAVIYYCVGIDCCPVHTLTARSDDRRPTILLPNDVVELKDMEGIYNLSFFSVDEYKNTEVIRSHAVFIDTKAPVLTFRIFSAVPDPATDDKSILLVNVSVNSYAICSDELWYGPVESGALIGSMISNKGVSKSYQVSFNGLADGRYNYKVTCRDLNGNEITEIKPKFINRNQKITYAAPPESVPEWKETYAGYEVPLYIETSDEYYCEYEYDGVWSPFSSGFKGQGTYCSSPSCACKGDTIPCYTYSETKTFPSSGVYTLTAKCWEEWDQTAGAYKNPVMGAETNLYFTIDVNPPNTVLKYLGTNNLFVAALETFYYKNTDMKLDCIDEPKNLPPSMIFGCKQTSYCITGEGQTCEFDRFIQAGTSAKLFEGQETGTHTICFSSEDNGGNTEPKKCQKVMFDKDPPIITISYPENNYVTKEEDEISVIGSWSDVSKITSIKVAWTSQDSKTPENIDFINSEFSTTVPLAEGENKIRVFATDFALPDGNKGESAATVYLDKIGPVIRNATIYNATSRIDSSCTTDCAKGEYGEPAVFRLMANDTQWCEKYYQNDISLVEMVVECISEDCKLFGTNRKKTFQMNSIGGNIYEKTLSAQDGLIIGKYKVRYIATDTLGNPSELAQTFEILDSDPYDIKIIEPPTNRTKSSKPTIIIETEIEMDRCELEYPITSEYYTTDDFTKSTDNPKLQTITTPQAIYPAIDGRDNPILITIRCMDVYGGPTKKTFPLIIDLKSPEIDEFNSTLGLLTSQTADSKYFTIVNGIKTKITIKTDEKTRCRYSSDMFSPSLTTDYSMMQNMTYVSGSYPHDYDSGSLNQESEWITINKAEHDNKKFTFNIVCEDFAERVSELRKIELEINYSKPIMIYDLSPVGYTNDPLPEVIAKTMRNTDCYLNSIAADDSSYNAWARDYVKEQTPAEWVFTTSNAIMYSEDDNSHIAQVVSFSENNKQEYPLADDTTYKFNMVCEDVYTEMGYEERWNPGIIDFEFTTDFSIEKPAITSPQNNILTTDPIIDIIGTTEPKAKYQIYINDEPRLYEPYLTETGSISQSLSLKEGENKIVVDVEDKGGNKASSTLYVTYQNIGPSSLLVTPINHGPFNKLNEIIAVIIDNGGGVSLDDSSIKLTNLDSNADMSSYMQKTTKGRNTLIYKMISPLETGHYKIEVYPKDSSNNLGYVDSVLFEVDTIVPEIIVELPLNLETTKDVNKMFRVLIPTTDIVTSVNLVFKDDRTINLGNMYQYTQDIQLNDGMNLYYFTVETEEGHYAESPSQYIFLDRTGPIAKCIVIEGEEVCEESDLSIQVEGKDLIEKIREVLEKVRQGLYVISSRLPQ